MDNTTLDLRIKRKRDPEEDDRQAKRQCSASDLELHEVLESIRVEQEAVVPFDFEEEAEMVEPPVITLPIVEVVEPPVITLPIAENQLQVMKSTSAILTTLQEMQNAFTTYMTTVNERLDEMEKSQGELLRLLSASAEASRSEVADSRRSSEEPQQQGPDIIDGGKTWTGDHHQVIIGMSGEDRGHGTVTVITVTEHFIELILDS